MYKTVRQGENSLQYRILPQDDHVISKRRRSAAPRHRTAFILVITLILGCAIIAAAVLIPALMASNVVTLPARFQTFAIAASSINPRAHGKYSLQGAQYIALLPVKDLNGYQLRPASPTITASRNHERLNSDPQYASSQHPSRWMSKRYMPWVVSYLLMWILLIHNKLFLYLIDLAQSYR